MPGSRACRVRWRRCARRFRLPSEQHAAAARRDHLVAVEAEAADVAERSAELPSIARAERLGGVLDHARSRASRERADRIHVDRMAVQVNDDDRPGRRARCSAAMDAGVDAVRLGIDVGEDRRRADVAHRRSPVATNVSAGTITSSPGPIPSSTIARCSAAVPLTVETASGSVVIRGERPLELAARTGRALRPSSRRCTPARFARFVRRRASAPTAGFASRRSLRRCRGAASACASRSRNQSTVSASPSRKRRPRLPAGQLAQRRRVAEQLVDLARVGADALGSATIARVRAQQLEDQRGQLADRDAPCRCRR